MYSRCGNQNICDIVDILGKVDYMVVMDTYAIDEIGENADNGMYNGAQIYGMGTSVKSVALLDAGKIKCLVIPDGYGVGYASVTEVVKGLNSRLYTMKSREEGIKIIYSDDLFSDDVERIFKFHMSRQKRRKIYVLLLAAAMIVSLMGCGSSNEKIKQNHESRGGHLYSR